MSARRHGLRPGGTLGQGTGSMTAGQVFLLDPDNEPFATGASTRLAPSGHGCILLFLSLFMMAGVLIVADLSRRWVHMALLHTVYGESQGQVVQRWIEFDEGALYRVTYHFLVDDRAYTVEEIVEKATYHAVEEGQAVTVRYVQSNPAIATIEPGRVGGLLALSGFCLVWNGGVFGISGWLAREVLKRRSLARDGRRLVGEIVQCASHRDDDGDLVLDVRYRFRSPQTGTWVVGHDSRLRKDMEHSELPPPGTVVHVLYLDDVRHMML